MSVEVVVDKPNLFNDLGETLKTITTRPAEEIMTLKSGFKDSRSPKTLEHEKRKFGVRHSRPGLDKKPKGITQRRANSRLKRDRRDDLNAIFRLSKSEILQTTEAGYVKFESGDECTSLSHEQICSAATLGVAKKHFSFDLPYGPYQCGYTNNGGDMIIGGRKGHVCMLNCETMQLNTELHLKETIRAVQAFHNNKLFGVAQKKYVHIYDKTGVEVHCMKKTGLLNPTHLDFLPYHFLLVISNDWGFLQYCDITTGESVAKHRTQNGQTCCLRQNKLNAVVHVGHVNGRVTLWTPNVKKPVVEMWCHNACVASLAVHADKMVTVGSNNQWKVWDLRKYECEFGRPTAFRHPVADVDISASGILAVGAGPKVQFWKDWFHLRPQAPDFYGDFKKKRVSCVRFRPYEDVCAVGSSDGLAGLICPGAGQANFDSLEGDPYETKAQTNEKEIRSLMDKLQPDSIMLDPGRLGKVEPQLARELQEEEARNRAAEEEKKKKERLKRKRTKGRNKPGRRLARKEGHAHAQRRLKTKDRLKKGDERGNVSSEDEDEHETEDADAASEESANSAEIQKPIKGVAIDRFRRKCQRKLY